MQTFWSGSVCHGGSVGNARAFGTEDRGFESPFCSFARPSGLTNVVVPWRRLTAGGDDAVVL